MPRSFGSYCLHKAPGQAYVKLNGKAVYLGKHGTPESRREHARVLAEFLESKQQPEARTEPKRAPSVNEPVLAFWRFVKQRYVKNGQPTSEQRSYEFALRPVARLYGKLPVSGFGPLGVLPAVLPRR